MKPAASTRSLSQRGSSWRTTTTTTNNGLSSDPEPRRLDPAPAPAAGSAAAEPLLDEISRLHMEQALLSRLLMSRAALKSPLFPHHVVDDDDHDDDHDDDDDRQNRKSPPPVLDDQPRSSWAARDTTSSTFMKAHEAERVLLQEAGRARDVQMRQVLIQVRELRQLNLALTEAQQEHERRVQENQKAWALIMSKKKNMRQQPLAPPSILPLVPQQPETVLGENDARGGAEANPDDEETCTTPPSHREPAEMQHLQLENRVLRRLLADLKAAAPSCAYQRT